MKKSLWILFAALAIMVGLYPIIYFLIDRKFGLLGTKSSTLLNNVAWNISFYTHIVFGGIALLIGWIQFNENFRNKRMHLHKKIGKVYMICVSVSAIGGMYIAFHATGGIITSAAFITLDVIWLYSTIAALYYIKNGNILRHQIFMIFSYAATFGAVTLRIWLPLFSWLYGNFFKAYPIAAWMAFIPNMIVAYFIAQKVIKKNAVTLK